MPRTEHRLLDRLRRRGFERFPMALARRTPGVSRRPMPGLGMPGLEMDADAAFDRTWRRSGPGSAPAVPAVASVWPPAALCG